MNAFFRDYKIDPADSGAFHTDAELRGDDYGRDMSSERVKGGAVYTFDNPKENPVAPLRYFCRVGGGFQGFRFKRNAVNFENQPA